MRQIFLDTETTGLEVAEGHRVIEIGCVELLNRQPTGNDLHLYLNPERAIDAGAQAVHGITAEFLADKPVFADVAQQFLDFIRGADEVIIHNAPFDVGFLDRELQLLQQPAFASHVGSVVDSLAMAKARYPGKRARIEGHADERGTREYNLALGERRANAAKNYLVSLGIDASRLTVVSYGKERPEALGSDENAWARNRRAVTVTID